MRKFLVIFFELYQLPFRCSFKVWQFIISNRARGNFIWFVSAIQFSYLSIIHVPFRCIIMSISFFFLQTYAHCVLPFECKFSINSFLISFLLLRHVLNHKTRFTFFFHPLWIYCPQNHTLLSIKNIHMMTLRFPLSVGSITIMRSKKRKKGQVYLTKSPFTAVCFVHFMIYFLIFFPIQMPMNMFQ
jgi:hypothetical protein